MQQMDGGEFCLIEIWWLAIGDGMALLAVVFFGVFGSCGANHWRALDFTAAGACFRGFRLLGDALGGAQGHCHPVGHPALEEGH